MPAVATKKHPVAGPDGYKAILAAADTQEKALTAAAMMSFARARAKLPDVNAAMKAFRESFLELSSLPLRRAYVAGASAAARNLALALERKQLRTAGGAGSGDLEGHEFHGNQYTKVAGNPASPHRADRPSPWKSPEHVRAIINQMGTATREDVEAGRVPGVIMGDPNKVGSMVVAQYQMDTGEVKVFPQFFTLDSDPFGRRGLLAHEFGHEISARSFSTSDPKAAVEAFRPFRKNPDDPFVYDSPFGFSSRFEEMIADTYAGIMMANNQQSLWEEEDGKYAKAYKYVIGVARKAGLPLPDWAKDIKVLGGVGSGDLEGHDFHGNQWTGGKGGSGAAPYAKVTKFSVVPEHQQANVIDAQYLSDVIAARHGIEPVLTRVFREDENRAFTLNGEKMQSAGQYRKGPPAEIILSPDLMRASVAERTNVMVHELTHHVWQKMIDAQAEEQHAIDDLIGDDYNVWMTKGGWLRPEKADEFGEKFPVTRMFGKYLGSVSGYGLTEAEGSKRPNRLDRLREEDGITNYSRQWWTSENSGQAKWSQAVNETLAEVSAELVAGHKAYIDKIWLDLHAGMFEAYAKLPKEKRR